MRKIGLGRLSPKRYRPGIKIFKMKWEFHQYDVDPFPSIPHGHSIETKEDYTLNIYTGDVYDRRAKKKVGSASQKELRALRRNAKFKEFIEREREFHRVSRIGIRTGPVYTANKDLEAMPFIVHLTITIH